MSRIFHRTLTHPPPTVTHGKGSYLYDSSGKQYLDACGGAAVSCLGHGHPAVSAAISNQLDQVAFAHNGFFTNVPAEELASFLTQRAADGFQQGRVMYLGSGSEAMEAALKLARQYHLECGNTERSQIIARQMSYHGNTLGALAIGGHAGRRAPYTPLLIKAHHIPACYAYRLQNEHETEQAYGRRCAETLESQIVTLGAERVAAFVVEPVVGATLGSVPAVRGYFKRIREICDQYGVLLIADEVMCGMGRTGSLFALQQEDISPDIMTIAKGLGAGFQPVAAVLASENLCRAVEAGSNTLWNGHTYMSHAVSCAAALAVLKVIEDENLLTNVRSQGLKLATLLSDRFKDHPHVGDIRGRGLFLSLELVSDRLTKQPFSAEHKLAIDFKARAFANGLLCYPSTGCVDGVRGDHVLLAPSYRVTDDELVFITDVIETTLAQCLASVPSP